MKLRQWANLVLAVAAVASIPALAEAANINPTVVFAEDPNQVQTRMTLAFDGTYYWSVSGGGTFGIREAQYASNGAFIADFTPGLDFRSDFTDAAGNLYARQFANPTIYKQTAPGSFTPFATLIGGSLDAQSGVVLNGAGTEYLAFNMGVVTRWNLAGTLLGTLNLSGFGSVAGENSYPANRGIAAAGNNLYTYNSGILSTWDLAGNRIAQDNLVGGGASFDSNFSLSFANGLIFVENSGSWRGYDVGASQTTPVPEPTTCVLVGLGLGAAIRRRLRA